MAYNSGETVVPLEEFHAFVVRCMTAVGVRTEDAGALADLLVAADNRGHFSHGLNRLEMYVTDIETGQNAVDTRPEIVNQTAATALVDGNNALGPVVGKFCMDLAIEKAKETGIGWVSARGSNHFGIAGWYGIRAVEQGLLGMSFTNTSPLLVPTRAKTETLGTNPICLAAPANNGDSFVLDMATTSVALGKIELAERKGQPIPKGWAADCAGKVKMDMLHVLNKNLERQLVLYCRNQMVSDVEPTTDPTLAVGLSPLGGAEETSGYKGYGLSMMVEIFCGILSGAMYGPRVRKWKETDRQADLGQCFMALDPKVFAPGFTDRMSDLMERCRNLEPAEGETEVLVAGDPERKHMAKCDKLGGIPYHANQIKFANDLAARLKVEPMKSI